MNTIYDDEATRYQGADDEATRFDESAPEVRNEETVGDTATDNEIEVKAVKKSSWKRVMTGAGSGLLIGGVASMLMGMKSAESVADDGKPEADNHRDELSNPEWVDDKVQVATTVNDDMSFGEAFAAAREEVGPGGCFEWHGGVYGTYTADEWNGMTAEERAEFGDHFNWNNLDHSSSEVAHHSETARASHTAHNSAQAEASEDNTAHVNPTDEPGANVTDDIEVITVDHNTGNAGIAQNDHIAQQSQEIEILGVVHDSETGANIGGMSVDGQEVILIDVDGNMEFDVMGADLNGNGQLDPNEIMDIQGQGYTVNGMGGFSDPLGGIPGEVDGPDYSLDSYEG